MFDKVAIFRQFHKDNPHRHHDFVEFPNGEVELLTRLDVGQHATVLTCRQPRRQKPSVRSNAALNTPAEAISTPASAKRFPSNILVAVAARPPPRGPGRPEHVRQIVHCNINGAVQ
jgi:hypothetical protein